MRSATSKKFFLFPAVASPTYDDHSNYVDEVSFRLFTARIVILTVMSVVSTRLFSIRCVHFRRKEVLAMYPILMTTLMTTMQMQ